MYINRAVTSPLFSEQRSTKTRMKNLTRPCLRFPCTTMGVSHCPISSSRTILPTFIPIRAKFLLLTLKKRFVFFIIPTIFVLNVVRPSVYQQVKLFCLCNAWLLWNWFYIRVQWRPSLLVFSARSDPPLSDCRSLHIVACFGTVLLWSFYRCFQVNLPSGSDVRHLPPLTVAVSFAAETARSLPTTGWSFSCRKRRGKSSGGSRWAGKRSSTSSDSSSTTRRRIGLSRCTSVQILYRCFKVTHEDMSANNRRIRAGPLLRLWSGIRTSPAWRGSAFLMCQQTRCTYHGTAPPRPSGATPPRAVCSDQTPKTLKLFENSNEHLHERQNASNVFFSHEVIKLPVRDLLFMNVNA